jgi:hypothetical protein
MPERKLIATLRDMHQGGVQFIVVGGLAAVLQGAPVDIFDVDIVHFRDSANDARILPVLDALDAIFRMQPERRLRPNAGHLASPRHLNLMTSYGPWTCSEQSETILSTRIWSRAPWSWRLPKVCAYVFSNLETLIATRKSWAARKTALSCPRCAGH